MSKKSMMEVSDVEIVTEEETQALMVRAAAGEIVESNGGGARLLSPQFIKVSKDTANAVIGKENYQLLKAGETTECILIKIDGLGWMKSDESNPMSPPIKYGNTEQAQAAGEVCFWPPKGVAGPRPSVAPYRDFSVLVKAPGDSNPAFNVNIGTDDWAPGVYSCGRTGYYQNIGRPDNEEGIIKTALYYTKKQGLPLYQLLWTVAPVLHRYDTGFTSGYLKFNFKRVMKPEDPVFTAIRDALANC